MNLLLPKVLGKGEQLGGVYGSQAAEIQGSIWEDGAKAGGESFILEGETCRYEGLICCDRFPAEGKAVLGQSWLWRAENIRETDPRPY